MCFIVCIAFHYLLKLTLAFLFFKCFTPYIYLLVLLFKNIKLLLTLLIFSHFIYLCLYKIFHFLYPMLLIGRSIERDVEICSIIMQL